MSKRNLSLNHASHNIRSLIDKTILSKLVGDRGFYQTVLRLALPVTIQSFIMSSLNMVDTIMVGQLGETEIAAVGLSNQIYFILHLYIFAVSGSVSIFISQFWGKKDLRNIRRILGLGLMLNFASTFIFFLLAAIIPERLLSLFSDDQRLLNIGATYLRIVSLSYLLTAITATYSAALRSMEEVKLPMRASAIGISVNTALNYLLIFGRLGLPRLGVAGAAIATVIARFVEMGILLAATYGYRYLSLAEVKEMFQVPKDLIRRFLTTSSGVVVKDLIWAVGVTVYMAIYGRMGTEVVAAINITGTIRQLATVFFTGLANACLITVGKEIGAGAEEKAYLYSERFLTMTMVLGLLMGFALFWLKNLLLLPYNISPETAASAGRVLSVLSFVLPIAVFNMVGVVGVMRSGGDTVFCLFMDLFVVYLIGLPFAYLGGLVWGLAVEWVFALINVQEIFKMVLLIKRFVTKRWINNLVHDVG